MVSSTQPLSNRPISALVVGLGSIGRRHLANLRALIPDSHITLLRHKHYNTEEEILSVPDAIVYELEDAIAHKPDVALLACPAPTHVNIGQALAQQGVHLFIEKPISDQLDGVSELIDIAKRGSLVLMVGYNFRFYEPLQKLRRAIVGGLIGRPLFFRAEAGQFLPEWRSSTDYTTSVSARAELGGGVILELSHEIDYVRWLFGEIRSVQAKAAKLSDLEIDVEDTVEIIVECESGVVGSIHLDMIQRPCRRGCQVIGTEGALGWDYGTHSVKLWSNARSHLSDLFVHHGFDVNQMYMAELERFLQCVRNRLTTDLSAEDGRRALEIAIAVKQASSTGMAVKL